MRGIPSFLKRLKKAFSLIEFMIIIVIITIVATLALASYNEHVMRTKVSEAIALMKFYAQRYEEYYMVNGFLPKSMAEVQLAAPNTAYVSQLWAGSSSSQGTGMYIYAILQDRLGFGINNRIMLGILANPNNPQTPLTFVCGKWQTTLYVPTQYLPLQCTQTSLSGFPGMVN